MFLYIGTGKTLMARKIGEMLHAREPKIVNGPGKCGVVVVTRSKRGSCIGRRWHEVSMVGVWNRRGNRRGRCTIK